MPSRIFSTALFFYPLFFLTFGRLVCRNDALLHRLVEGKGNDLPCFSEEKQSCPRREDKDGWGLDGYPLASVFAPLQSFDELYDLDTALARGTLFSKLDLPFEGDKRINKGGCCRGQQS